MKGFERKRCKICNSTELALWIRDTCEGCIFKVERPEEAGQQRTQYEEGECKLGYSCENGCTLLECKSCEKLEHFPWM